MIDRKENPRERKQRGVYILLCLLALAGFTAGVSAQYVVKSSDTLWGVAERNTEPKIAWQKIYDANAFLHEPGRRFDSNGKTIVVIHEGEILQGVNSEGMVPAIQPTPTPSPTATPNSPIVGSVGLLEQIPVWFWVVLGAVLFIFFLLWLFTRNPTRWRPMVTGGVDDQSAANRFNRYAQRNRATVIPGTIRKVRLYGIWGTQHRGISIPVPHRYDGERAYVARFRMPNGTEREGAMLQGCGNDISAGAWYTDFPGARVEEGWGDETTSTQNSASPTPEPAIQDVVEEEASDTAAPAAEEEDKIEDGVVRFELRKATDNMPAMVRLRGVNEKGDNTVEIKEGEILIRYTEARGSGFMNG